MKTNKPEKRNEYAAIYREKYRDKIAAKARKRWAELPEGERKQHSRIRYQRQKERVFAEILENAL